MNPRVIGGVLVPLTDYVCAPAMKTLSELIVLTVAEKITKILRIGL